jgi:hypothetical protein
MLLVSPNQNVLKAVPIDDNRVTLPHTAMFRERECGCQLVIDDSEIVTESQSLYELAGVAHEL